MRSVLRPTPVTTDFALVLGGGGARGAYQVGVLRYIANRYPHLRIPIFAGVSAGALNTIFLAAHTGTFDKAVSDLADLWRALMPEDVYRVDARALISNVVRSGYGLVSGERGPDERVRGMVDTSPLRAFLERALVRDPDGTLPGIAHNLARGSLRAAALTATSYTTGRSTTWVQGRDITMWERPERVSVHTKLTVDHVMASAALPIFFPAERVANEWYGDGGIRLTAPLSPALHLGASRVLTISTRHASTRAESAQPQIVGYPPPAQVLSVLYNAVFLDVIDQDVARLQLINQLVLQLPEEQRVGLRPVELLVLRPSVDLGVLARQYEPRLPRVFRFFTRGLGTRKSTSPSILAVLMFQTDFIHRLLELGEEDGERNGDRIAAFIDRSAATGVPAIRPSAS